jgi:hypothetical protein
MWPITLLAGRAKPTITVNCDVFFAMTTSHRRTAGTGSDHIRSNRAGRIGAVLPNRRCRSFTTQEPN